MEVLPGKVNQRPVDDNYQMLEDYDHDNLNSNQEGGKRQEDGEEDGG